MSSSAGLSTLQIGAIMSSTPGLFSGSERYFIDLVRALRPLGVTANGLVGGDPAASDDPVPGVESFAREGSGRLERLIATRRSVARLLRRTDLVASHFAPHAFPVLDKLQRLPLVTHFHGPWTFEGQAEGVGWKQLILRWIEEQAVYRRSARFIVLSKAYGDILRKRYGISQRTIRVIPGGVNLRRFSMALTSAQARERLGWSPNRPIIVTARRLAPTKGIATLIDAADIVRRRIPDVLFIIAGDGPLRPSLEARVQKLQLSANVRFAGFLGESLPLAYRAANLSIVPSSAFEGFGLSVVESLACGTPVLVTPVAGLPEVVADLDSHLIMDGYDAVTIADRLMTVLAGNISLPDETACLRYARRFDWPVIAARVLEVYREVA